METVYQLTAIVGCFGAGGVVGVVLAYIRWGLVRDVNKQTHDFAIEYQRTTHWEFYQRMVREIYRQEPGANPLWVSQRALQKLLEVMEREQQSIGEAKVEEQPGNGWPDCELNHNVDAEPAHAVH